MLFCLYFPSVILSAIIISDYVIWKIKKKIVKYPIQLQQIKKVALSDFFDLMEYIVIAEYKNVTGKEEL